MTNPLSSAKPIPIGIDKRKQTTSRFLVFGLISLVVLVIGVGVLLSTSTNTGEQFAVDGFQRRTFSYYDVLGYRLSATEYFPTTGNLELMLAKKKWITSTGKKPKDSQWVTVTHMTFNQAYVGDAKILVDYLEMSSTQGAIDLSAWSTNNPGYAAIMWPEIQTAAQGNMYILVPDIIHHMLDLSEISGNSIHRGKDAPKIEDLSKEKKAALIAQQTKRGTESLHPFLEVTYRNAGKAAQESGDTKRARFCYEQVLRFAPDAADIQAELDKLPAEPVEESEEEETPAEEEPTAEVTSEEDFEQ